MAVMCIVAVVSEVLPAFNKNASSEPTVETSATQPTALEETTPNTQPTETTQITATNPQPTEAETNPPTLELHNHSQNITVVFENGTMKFTITEKCNCGKTTTFSQLSKNKETALYNVENIECEDFVFCVVKDDQKMHISRAELIEYISQYDFSNES